MAQLEPYQYTPLPTDVPTIRLLKISLSPPEHQHLENNPASTSILPPLRGELLTHALYDTKTPYECLSYTWGQPTFTHTLTLSNNTASLPITTNLDRAIRGIIQVAAARENLIWIDAVCINQRDAEEKTQQVRLMGTIYARAAQVLGYLGGEEEGSECVPVLCEKEWETLGERQVEEGGGFGNRIGDEEIEGMGLPGRDEVVWVSFAKVIARAWFVRAWIIQEVVLARRVMLVCGGWVVPCLKLFHGVKLCAMYGLLVSHPQEEADGARGNDGVMQVLMMLDMILTHRIPERQVQKPCLLDLVRSSRHAGATDARDNLYAFLALSKDQAMSQMQPSYIEPIASTFIRFATSFVNSGSGGRLLELCYRSESELGLPSWVPDWSLRSEPYADLAPGNENSEEYARAGGAATDMKMKVSGNRLVMPGYIVDVIQNVGTALISSSRSMEKVPLKLRTGTAYQLLLKELLGCVEEVSNFLGGVERYHKGERKVDVVWRMLICNREVGPGHEAPSTYRLGFAALICMLKNTTASQKEAKSILRHFHESVISVEELISIVAAKSQDCIYREGMIFLSMISTQCDGRRRCQTQKRYLGQVPLQAQAGDVVCIVSGARIPFLLRPEGGEHSLIGQCYLHGFMKGEILSMQEHGTQDITLI